MVAKMVQTTVVGRQSHGRTGLIRRLAGDYVPPDSIVRMSEVLGGGTALTEKLARLQIRETIKDQDAVGLDILSEGETTRIDYWSHFVTSLSGVKIARSNLSPSGVDLIVTDHLNNVHDYIVSEWQEAQSLTSKPVKITLPGPLTCARYVRDEYYHSLRLLSLRMAECINYQAHRLAEAGCRFIQFDDCQLAYDPTIAFDYGLEHLEICTRGLPDSVRTILHICRGTPGFVDRYENTGKAPDKNCYELLLSESDQFPVDIISVEQAFHPSPISVFKNIQKKTLMVGVIDVASLHVESAEEIRQRALPFLELMGSDRLLLAPDCGFSAWTSPRLHQMAMLKLRRLVEATRLIKRTTF
jgi:5-methyltetrahydropteroyltriglutamate--homocysteine methyltransferase